MFKLMDPLPAGRQRAAAAAWRNFLYVLGGASNSGSTAGPTTILKSRVDMSENSNSPWVECASEFSTAKIGAKAIMLEPQSGGGNGVLMVIGGRGANVQAANVNAAADIWIGRLDSDGNIPRWNHLVGVLPSNLTDVSVVRSDSHLFVMGGLDIKVILSYKTQTTETRLNYDGQTVNFTVGATLTGGTSGATATIGADVDGGATGVLTLTGVVGTFQNNEVLTDDVNYLDYDAQTTNFTVGATVTGGTSGATGVVAADNDAGATGTLTLTGVVGVFQNNEALTDSINYLNYDAQTANFTVGQVVTGGTSGATGTIAADNDAGATGVLTLTGVVGVFQNNELLTDPLGGSADANGTLYSGTATVNGTLYNGTAVANGTQYSWGDFVAGEVITGGTSAATATIVQVNDAGATGTLILKDVSGTFQNNEDLNGSLVGYAVCDGTTALYQTSQTAIWRAKLDSDCMSLGGFTQVGALPAALSPINAVAKDRKRLVVSDTTSVYTARIEPSGEILPWVTSTAPESKVSHALVLMQNNDLVVLGGYNGANVKPSCWSTSIEPDGGIKRWQLQSSMLTEAMNCAIAVMNDRIFMIGGLDDASNVLTSVQVVRVNSEGQF